MFDCIIMNPPYERGLHLKILKEAITHLESDGKIMSLQPIVKWQEAKLFETVCPVVETSVLERFSMDDAAKLFEINQRCELGIVSNTTSSLEIVDNYSLLKKLHDKIIVAINSAGTLHDKLSKETLDFPVHFGYGVTVAGNGGHGKSCYRICGTNEANACRKEEVGHSRQYNAKNANIQHIVWKSYQNLIIRFITKEFGFGGIPYSMIPWLEGFKNEDGKSPLDVEWTFLDFCKWFSLDKSDINVIEHSLHNNLNDTEIEEMNYAILNI